MKGLLVIFALLLAALQYRLWVGEGSLIYLADLQAQIDQQSTENTQLQERKRQLAAEVYALKHHQDAIESRAREDLGMIKKGETFFMVVPEEGAERR